MVGVAEPERLRAEAHRVCERYAVPRRLLAGMVVCREMDGGLQAWLGWLEGGGVGDPLEGQNMTS